MTRKREMLNRLTRLEESVDRIERSIEKIEVATIVRDPSSKLSVDAYDGLRRQIVAAAGERTAHLHQLARFAQAVRGAQPAELASLVAEWMGQANLVLVEDPHDDRYFDVLGGDGEALRVIRPAYVDGATGRPVVMGQAERVPSRPPGAHRQPPTPAPATPPAPPTEPTAAAVDGKEMQA